MAQRAGMVALIGSAEFLPASETLDRVLLDHVEGERRVVVLPTASAPDGAGVPERWAAMGVKHFSALGAAVSPVMALTRADAESPALAGQIAAANFVYLSGGKPGYLHKTLSDSACWRAIQSVFDAGGVVAGCSAGAMALGSEMLDFPRLWRTQEGLGLAPGILVIPHFDEFGSRMGGLAGLAHTRATIVGVDGATGLVGSAGAWRVAGTGTVTILSGQHKGHYQAGDTVPID